MNMAIDRDCTFQHWRIFCLFCNLMANLEGLNANWSKAAVPIFSNNWNYVGRSVPHLILLNAILVCTPNIRQKVTYWTLLIPRALNKSSTLHAYFIDNRIRLFCSDDVHTIVWPLRSIEFISPNFVDPIDLFFYITQQSETHANCEHWTYVTIFWEVVIETPNLRRNCKQYMNILH